jgi:ubiquinone/menaquinone biosynthesis C-methylase UbiE
MDIANREQAELWATIAPTWVEVEDDLDQMNRDLGRMAMDRLDLHPGQQVLDIGCGTGRTTLELASRVAPDGRALGIDLTEVMLQRARQHAAQAGSNSVDFVHADAQVYDFGERKFDAAYSRFGVMFFSDPVAAFASIRRALRRGGLMSFVCWQPVEGNEWTLVPGLAAAATLDQTLVLPSPEEPGPYSLSDPARVRAVLAGAAFEEIDIQPYSDLIVIPEDRIPQRATLATRTGRVRDLLKDADEATHGRVLAAIEAALRTRLQDGEVRLRRSVFLVKARA